MIALLKISQHITKRSPVKQHIVFNSKSNLFMYLASSVMVETVWEYFFLFGLLFRDKSLKLLRSQNRNRLCFNELYRSFSCIIVHSLFSY